MMAELLYSLGLKLYGLALLTASLFNTKAKKVVLGQRNVMQYLSEEEEIRNSPLLWVHCASVGEYEQGRPVMELFKSRNPEYKILVTFYSPSGYEAVRTDKIVDFSSYLPFDSQRNVKQFMKLVC